MSGGSRMVGIGLECMNKISVGARCEMDSTTHTHVSSMASIIQSTSFTRSKINRAC